MARKQTDITFTCYKYKYNYKGIDNVTTLFLFYIDGIWDENKLTIGQAIKWYPPDEYNWIYIGE